jgi:hypothetical protein
VVIVQSTASALGGLLRNKGLRVQHADFQPTRETPFDRVDGNCTRAGGKGSW